MARAEKTTVLVAEDDPQILALVTRRLAKLGFEVFDTSDGDEALTLVRQKRPDAVVLGVVMPTGIGERLNEMTSPLYGADDYLDKPFEFPDLERKLKAAIQRRRKG